MGGIQTALERYGRRLKALLTRPRKPGPVADIDAAAAPPVLSADEPSGAEEPVPSFRNRARLRRRLRYLRQTRELGFRDLGGFLFDSRRLGRERDDIVEAKLQGLMAIDGEVRALETALDDEQEVTLLHEPGISVCPRCGALHGSEDNYCPACGLPVGRGLGLAIAQGGPGGAAVGGANAAPAAPAERSEVSDAAEPARDEAPAGVSGDDAAGDKAPEPAADAAGESAPDASGDSAADAAAEDAPTTETRSVAER